MSTLRRPPRRGLELDREDYGFYLGGLISSCALLLMLVVASQAL